MLVSKEHTETKRSLILAGGGMRVAYQAGVLMALVESGIKFNHVDGTSGGIFNTAMLASGLEPGEMAKRWRTLNTKHFISGRKFKDYLKPLSMTGYADADNIRNKVFPHLGIEENKIRHNPSINATFNVCNFSDKSVEAIAHPDVTEDHLIAGVSLPLLMPAIQIGKDWYIDAVWIKDANLMEAVRQQSEELWLVWAIGNTRTYIPGAFNQYVHMIEMSANGALLEEFSQINLINDSIRKGRGNCPQDKPIKLFIIKSPDPLPLDPDLFFNRVNARELINMGYENAKNQLIKQPVHGVALDKEATKSMDPGTVLSFRATFSGILMFDSEETTIIYYAYFRFNRTRGNSRLSIFSSMYISLLDQETIAYGHRVQCIRNENATVLKVTAKLLIHGEEQQLSTVFRLANPIALMMGLALKSVDLTIGDGANPLLQGTLYQSIANRLKACYHISVKTPLGKEGGFGKRFQMISKLFEYEV